MRDVWTVSWQGLSDTEYTTALSQTLLHGFGRLPKDSSWFPEIHFFPPTGDQEPFSIILPSHQDLNQNNQMGQDG